MKRSRARSEESIEFARTQRQTANELADTVWQWLRNRQCCGQKFRREVPIPPYTVDFCCVALKVIIEIDGKDHFTQQGLKHDRDRDAFLRAQGYQVLRIPGYDVIRDGRGVIERMENCVRDVVKQRESPSPPDPLSPKRGEGEPEELS